MTSSKGDDDAVVRKRPATWEPEPPFPSKLCRIDPAPESTEIVPVQEIAEIVTALGIGGILKKPKARGQPRLQDGSEGSFTEYANMTDEEYSNWHRHKFLHEPEIVKGKILRLVTKIEISNNVITAKLKFAVPLPRLKKILAFMGAEYSVEKKFPSLCIHFAADKVGIHVAMAIFGTGNIVCPGGDTPEGTIIVLFRVVDLIEKYFPGVGPPSIAIRNVVGTMRNAVNMDLKALYTFMLRERQKEGKPYRLLAYDPEDFPGLQCSDDTGLMFLAFTPGPVVITNGRKEEDIRNGALIMHERMWKCGLACPGSIQPCF